MTMKRKKLSFFAVLSTLAFSTMISPVFADITGTTIKGNSVLSNGLQIQTSNASVNLQDHAQVQNGIAVDGEPTSLNLSGNATVTGSMVIKKSTTITADSTAKTNALKNSTVVVSPDSNSSASIDVGGVETAGIKVSGDGGTVLTNIGSNAVKDSNGIPLQPTTDGEVKVSPKDPLYSVIFDINNAKDIQGMKSALEATALGLNLTEYNKLDNGLQTEVINYVLKYKPASGYKTKQEVQTKLDEAVKNVSLRNDQVAAQAVKGEIEALPAVGALKLTDKAAVVKARSDYDQLTATQKALVDNEAKLTAAEGKIAELENAAITKESAKTTAEAKLGEIPATENITAGTIDAAKTAVQAAKDAIAAAEAAGWSSTEISNFANYTKLKAAEDKLTELAPVVSDLSITGDVKVKGILTVSYTYTDAGSDPEGDSLYQWYADGGEITGATQKVYVVQPGDVGKSITCRVTPVSKNGHVSGVAVTSPATAAVAATPIGNLGLDASGKTKDTVNLWFTAPLGAENVKLMKLTDGTSWIDTGVVVTASSRAATVTGLEPDTTYYFKLVVTGGAYAGDSNIFTVNTASSVVLDTVGQTANTVDLKFTAPGVSGTKIMSSVDTGNSWQDTGLVVGENDTTARVENLLPNTMYKFKLVMGTKESNVVDVTTNSDIELMKASTTSTSVTLNFAAPAGASVVVLYQKEDGTIGWATVDIPLDETSTTVTIDGLIEGKNYQFYLQIIDGDHEGDTNVVNVQTSSDKS